MRRKIINIIVSMLVIVSSVCTIFTNTIDVQADIGNPGEVDIGLDVNYMWNVTSWLANVVHKFYDPGEIRKGRFFGSEGDRATANYLARELEVNCSFDTEDISKIPLGFVEDYPDRHYTNFIDTISYELTINHPDFTSVTGLPESTLPIDDFYPIVGVKPMEIGGSVSCTHEYEEIRVLSFDKWIEDAGAWSSWPCGGALTEDCRNATCDDLNDAGVFCGNVTYLTQEDEIPEDQELRVFLVDEEEGCEDILDNVTESIGVILINNNSKYNCPNPDVYPFSITRVDIDDSNITFIKQELLNGSLILVDNYVDNISLTFTLGIDGMNGIWPDYDFVFIDAYPDDNTMGYGIFITDDLSWSTICGALWTINLFMEDQCLGVLRYDSQNDDTHQMFWQVRDWYRIHITNKFWITPFFALPGFSINKTIGNFLIGHHGDEENTISGNLTQVAREENESTPAVETYNVEAYLNITESPDDKIVVISNRYDAMWGECPGDSGLGTGIIMGIAKYFKDYGIIPKYNITFLFTTGEELGFRGAQYYNDTHPDANIAYWIGTDQLGFNQDDSFLEMAYRNYDARDIVWAIANESNYDSRTTYQDDNHSVTWPPGNKLAECIGIGAEDHVFQERGVDTILIHKNVEDDNWTYHHRRGLDLSEGDVMKNIDTDDGNWTFEFAWNITKYFCVNPDCWFTDVTYTPFDSTNDGDLLPDSIKVNFTLDTVIPHDKVMVKLFYSQNTGGGWGSQTLDQTYNYTLTRDGRNIEIVFTIPDSVSIGNYSLELKLFNSTGRINDIVNIGGNKVNDTSTSSAYTLYHALGYPQKGATYQCVHDTIVGSVFTANEDGVADNITAFINQEYMSPGPYRCMLYRANDSLLIGATLEDWESLPQPGPFIETSWWASFPFEDPKPELTKGTEYILTCWGEDEYCFLYYDVFASNRGRTNTSTYDSQPPQQPQFTNQNRLYSIYCSYTSTSPEITNISAAPNTVGFGYNVTITADVSDGDGIVHVNLTIMYPDEDEQCYQMNHVSGTQYQHIFSDTWLHGQYDFTITAFDALNNSNTSNEYTFNVTVHATTSIATLQDIYGPGEYLNITDPPNPPENYILTTQGLTWNEYYNADTSENILETFTEPVNYQNQTGVWTPINQTLRLLNQNDPAYTYGYRIGNDQGLYNVYFKPDIQNSWPVAFAYNKSTNPTTHIIRSKLVGVGYLDPSQDWAYEYLQNVRSSNGILDGSSVLFEDVFTGTDLIYQYGNGGLKEELILSNTTKALLENHPPSEYGLSDQESFLVFITKLDYQNLMLYNTSGVLMGNVTIDTDDITLRDALGQVMCWLPLGEAYEQHNESARHHLQYRFLQYNGNYYLLSGVQITALYNMTFPVVVDPTLSVYADTNDGYIYSGNTNYNTAWAASTGTISSTTTSITIGQLKGISEPQSSFVYRGFLLFNTSQLPSNANITTALLQLYKKDDYSTQEFRITLQNGQPTYPHNPLQTGDYNKTYYSGDGGGLNTTDFVNGKNNITITDHDWIIRNDWTKLCLRSSRDINGTAPSGNEYVTVYSRNSMIQERGPKLIISYSNQSKINNTGSTNISGHLLIQVQYLPQEEQSTWVVDSDTINETIPRTIPAGEQLGLDTIFNGVINTNNLSHGDGLYRVYVAFRDSDGNILVTSDEEAMVAWYEFEVAGL